MPAIGLHAGFQPPQKLGKVGERILFNLAGAVFQFVVIVEQRGGGVAVAVEGLRVVPDSGALHIERHADGVEQGLLFALVRHLTRLDLCRT